MSAKGHGYRSKNPPKGVGFYFSDSESEAGVWNSQSSMETDPRCSNGQDPPNLVDQNLSLDANGL